MVSIKKFITILLLLALIIPVIPQIVTDSVVRKINIEYTKILTLTITAYTSSVKECDASPYITASGDSVGIGCLGISRNLLYDNSLYFGSRVHIEGFGNQIFIVKDVMNQRFINRADIWMEYYFQAKNHGIQKLKVSVLPDSI